MIRFSCGLSARVVDGRLQDVRTWADEVGTQSFA